MVIPVVITDPFDLMLFAATTVLQLSASRLLKSLPLASTSCDHKSLKALGLGSQSTGGRFDSAEGAVKVGGRHAMGSSTNRERIAHGSGGGNGCAREIEPIDYLAI